MFQLEERQKQAVAREATSTSASSSAAFDPIQNCVDKSMFLLKFAGLTKVHLKHDVSAPRYDVSTKVHLKHKINTN